MAGAYESGNIVVDQNLTEFFYESLHEAIVNQGAQVNEPSEYYLVNLLIKFAKADHLYGTSEGKAEEEAMALLLIKAMESIREERIKIYKRLGDYALYISGFFSDSLSGKLVDIDYYITIGGDAYHRLARLFRARPQGESFYELFADLGSNFPLFVDLLSEVSDRCFTHTNRDILRIYEKWVRTGSSWNKSLLAEQGILPTPNVKTPFIQ